MKGEGRRMLCKIKECDILRVSLMTVLNVAPKASANTY